MGIARHLRDVLTLWTVSGRDGFGGYTFADPVTILGRWEQSQQKFITDAGEESVSQAIVYLGSDVTVGDWLGEGDLTASPDPTIDTVSSFRIRGFSRVANLRNSSNNRRAFI